MARKKLSRNASTKTLSTLVFCLGAGSSAHAAQPAVNIQALELLQENKISQQEFKDIVSSPNAFLSASNYSDFVSEGNYANFLSASNYSDFVSEGNYSNFISSGNYDKVPEDKAEAELPSPQISL